MSDLDKEELETTRNMGKTADETENEIEKIIQFMIDDNYNIGFISSIRSLLALYKTYLSFYNKEKEQNAIQRKMLNDAFDRGWIHKDKIREKIKEYDGLKEIDLQAYEEQIKPLKELLEEE